MGDKKRMGNRNKTIKLYTLQTNTVKDKLFSDGIVYSKREYVRNKYQESAEVFILVYDFLVKEMIKYIDKPVNAEYPYFHYMDLYNIEKYDNIKPLHVEVPLDEIVLFDYKTYTKVMTFKYLGEDEEEEKEFENEIEKQGLNYYKIMMSNFYVQYKNKIIDSWKNLFRYNEDFKKGDYTNKEMGIMGVSFCIKKEWIV